jgi:peptide-methionine (S)-S-oxide reductase
VNVYYDPKEISFETLCEVYFAGQDPTQVNGQGPDHGTQYRSIAFYRTPQEKSIIENQIKALTASASIKSRLQHRLRPSQNSGRLKIITRIILNINPEAGMYNLSPFLK